MASILKDVRATYNAVVQVAAGPAVAPNVTALYYANDKTQRRDNQMLVDSSGNGNDLIWEGYARPNREFTALLATGVWNAHVRAEVLANPAQAQRMGANQTYCFVFGEVNKTREGCMFQVRGDASDNGVHVRRASGGFKLRTVNGGTIVNSPDTLSWRGGNAKLILIIGTSTVTLLDRDNGSSISLARPSWSDEGVKTHVGSVRSSTGTTSDLSRAYLYTYSVHPYALSDIQRRRNTDFLLTYAPKSDGKGEYPDNAIVIALWSSALGLYRNLAAPGLNIRIVPSGTVTAISGGGISIPKPGESHVYAETNIPSSQVVTWLTTILDFNQGFEYGSQIGLMDSQVATGNVTLTKHASGQAFPMSGKPDYTHNYKTVGDKVKSGKTTFQSRISNNAKDHTLTEYQTGKTGTVEGTVKWTGNYVLALGVIKRSNGTYQDETNTKNLGVVLVRGELAADDLITSRKLLEA